MDKIRWTLKFAALEADLAEARKDMSRLSDQNTRINSKLTDMKVAKAHIEAKLAKSQELLEDACANEERVNDINTKLEAEQDLLAQTCDELVAKRQTLIDERNRLIASEKRIEQIVEDQKNTIVSLQEYARGLREVLEKIATDNDCDPRAEARAALGGGQSDRESSITEIAHDMESPSSETK